MRWEDIRKGVFLYLLIPVHLLIAYLIELVAAAQARAAHARRKKDEEPPKLRAAWLLIAFAHGINATVSLYTANYVIYYHIYHPLVGTICQFHAGEYPYNGLFAGYLY